MWRCAPKVEKSLVVGDLRWKWESPSSVTKVASKVQPVAQDVEVQEQGNKERRRQLWLVLLTRGHRVIRRHALSARGATVRYCYALEPLFLLPTSDHYFLVGSKECSGFRREYQGPRRSDNSNTTTPGRPKMTTYSAQQARPRGD